MTDLLSDLSDPQREAVLHVDGPLLVLAGAGSGKTRVITRRIAHLVLEHGIDPSSILAITFTNKAAGEMLERVRALVPGSHVWIATFHSFCAALLRRFASQLAPRTRAFTIYDSADQLHVTKSALAELEVDTTQHRPSAVHAAISAAKNRLETADDLIARQHEWESRIVGPAYRLYEKKLVGANAVDFDDLLILALRLLESDETVRRAHHERFRFLLVDEYQDTNRPQYRLARALAEAHGNLCATGDPDQSIYRWRGADIGNILEFERDFPGARVIRLEENYRSTGNILRAASELIRHNRQRKEKTLFTRGPDGEPVHLLCCEDETAEARTITERINAATRADRKLGDIAVFYRTNGMSRPIEEALIRAKIPYTIIGAVEFFERREVRDIVAYLRALANPADTWAVERILNVPRRGIGDRTAEILRKSARERGISLGASVDEPPAALDARARSAVGSLGALLRRLRALPQSPVEPVFQAVVDATDYLGYLRSQDLIDLDDRIENVRALQGAVTLYDEEKPTGSLGGFLEEIALLSDVDALEERPDRVTLMTLHAAKGLEFPVVFMMGLEERILPHQRSVGDEDEIEEERRLCHVGMTRAKVSLWLSTAARRTIFGAPMPQEPSRFLHEIPRDVLAVESPERVFEPIGFGASTWTEPAETGDSGVFAPGDRVRHPYFGAGTIIAVAGAKQNQKVTVRFADGAERKLAIEYAKLSREDLSWRPE
ncbi:MAG: UvrD-helicase domain-containing protein [Planctomycetes bacterium]|nr:UvrD-helicase domain-containing protein [Planctomycetota bacterium]MBI3845635.1 UvrD-helicase domain-containing protein [Planctomycetota bacterium]